MNRRRVAVDGRRSAWLRVRVSEEELGAIRAAAVAADLSVGRFVVERALDVQPRPATLLRELFALRRLLRSLDGVDEALVIRLERVLEGLER